MNRETPAVLAPRLDALWRDAAVWITDHTTQILIAAILGGVIAALLLGLKWLGKRLERRNPAHSWPHLIGSGLSKIRMWFVIAAVAQVIAGYAHAPDDFARTIQFLFVIAFALQGAVFAREVVLGLIEHRAAGHASLGNALGIIRVLVTFALFAVAVILILSNLGVNVTGLVAGLGIGGIAIGLAAQGIFRDLFAALSILFDRPFVIGDLIKFGDVTGRVETIGLKTTRIRSLDGEEVIMSNDKLLDLLVRNYHAIESRRIVLTLPLHYGNDPAKLAALPGAIRGLIDAIPDSRFDQAQLSEFRDNAVMLETILHATTGDASTRDRIRHETISAILAYLDREGVAISYNAVPMQA
ncbi:MAG: mechanosensitive ion channel family protein [Sphingomonadaceae bacterium]